MTKEIYFAVILVFTILAEINDLLNIYKILTMNTKNEELKSITDTINLYSNGLHNGDIEMLKKAFHPRAMMYGVSQKAVTIVEIEGLYGFVSANNPPSKTGEPHQCTITSIQHSGNAAAVEMVEESAYGSDYINYFHLLKIEGKWAIVSKTYNTVSKS